MGEQHELKGACGCGRNRYAILIPKNSDEIDAQVFFDDTLENRRAHATPLTAWLRFPLSWYQSHTTAYMPDETHSSIRKTFTPHHAPHCKRNFCGFCGTHLTYWSEQPITEADYLNVTVETLAEEGIDFLRELDLLSEDMNPGNLTGAVSSSRPSQVSVTTSQNDRAVPRSWKTRRGVAITSDGSTKVEWEVSELGGAEEEEERTGRAKRKVPE